MNSRRSRPAQDSGIDVLGPRLGPVGLPVVLGVLSFLVLSGGMPAYLLANVPDVGRSNAWAVTLAVMIWAGIRLSLLAAEGRARLFDLFFWLFTYIFMGLAPTVQIRSDQLPGTTPGMDPALDLSAAFVVVLGLVCYELGSGLAAFRERRREPEGALAPTATSQINTARTAALVVVAALASAYVVSKLGFALFLGSREAATIAREAAWPDPAVRSVITSGATYPILIAVGALAQLRVAALTAARRRTILLATLASLVLVFSVVSPVSSPRYTLGTVLFAIVVYLGAIRTRLRVRMTMIGTVLAFLFVFPLADAYRREGTGSLSRSGFFGEYLGNADYDSYWQIANAYAYWQDGLVEPLRQLSGSLLFWVPRSLWPGKPSDTGIVLAQYRGYSFDNLSAPLWAEALANAGVAGVVLAFFGVGYALRRLDTKILPSFGPGGWWALVGAVFPVFMTILLRGSLLQATGALAISIVCVLFVRQWTPPTTSQTAYADSS